MVMEYDLIKASESLRRTATTYSNCEEWESARGLWLQVVDDLVKARYAHVGYLVGLILTDGSSDTPAWARRAAIDLVHELDAILNRYQLSLA